MGGASRFSDAWPSAVIARKVSKRTDVAIQSEALCGMPGDAGGCLMVPTGLPRRWAPRNDNAKTWGLPKRSLDCRVAALLAMTKGMPGRCGGCPMVPTGLPGRWAPRNDNAKTWRMPKRSLDCRVAALLAMTTGGSGGRERAGWDGSAGLPRRGFAPSRNDNGGKPTTLGLRLLGLARLRLGPRPASLRPVLSARPSSFRPKLPYWLASRRQRRKPRESTL
jgi:hypothetical protein